MIHQPRVRGGEALENVNSVFNGLAIFFTAKSVLRANNPVHLHTAHRAHKVSSEHGKGENPFQLHKKKCTTLDYSADTA